MKIRIKIQRHLAVGHLAEDDGTFVFVICRRGLEWLLDERLKSGEDYLVEITGKKLTEEKHGELTSD